MQNNFQRAEDSSNRNVGLALTVLQRRLASSLAAIRLSLERRLRRLKELQRLGKLKQEFGESCRTTWTTWPKPTAGSSRTRLVERLTMAENMAELEAEIDELERARRSSPSTPEARHQETKFEELRKVVSEHLSGRQERLLVFTEHKDTLDFLVGKLTTSASTAARSTAGCRWKSGSPPSGSSSSTSPSIMVATEAAGEGINLQFCSLMVNYDIPWNPNRLEQRMGRIHRYKQKHEVMIFNLVAKNTREGEVMDWLLRKLEDMRVALGSDRVYDVIGEIIPAPRFDALMKDWLAKRRSMTEILAEIELQTDEQQVARIRADMEDKALGSRYIDMSKRWPTCPAEQGTAAHARVHREVLRRGVPLLRRARSRRSRGTRGVWSISRVPPDLRKLPEAHGAAYGKIGAVLPQADVRQGTSCPATPTWNSSAPATRCSRAWSSVCCGNTARSLRQGAVFYNADATEPTVLWLLKCGVEDGRGQTVGRAALRRPPHGRPVSARASPTPCWT